MRHWRTILTAGFITLIAAVAMPLSGWTFPTFVLCPLVAMMLLFGLSMQVAKREPPVTAGLVVLLGSLPISMGALAYGAYMNRDWSPNNSSVWTHIWLIAMAVTIALHAFAILTAMWWKHSMTDGDGLSSD